MDMYTQQVFKEDTRYGYACGRIRVLETKLLNRSAIMRLVEAESAHEALRGLSEYGYSSSLSEISEPEDFESALLKELGRTYDLIDELSLDPKLTQIFRLKWDFHNLKVLLKSYFQKERLLDVELIPLGSVPVDNLKLSLDPDIEKEKLLPKELSGAIDQVISQYEINPNPQVIDLTIDNLLHELLYQQASENQFLRDYLKAFADLTNIKTFVRIKMMNEGIRLLDLALLPFGELDKQLFLRRFDDSIESWVMSLSNTPYGALVSEGFRRWSEDHSLSLFEKLSDNYLINYLKIAQYVIFGVEPLIAYGFAKENEIKLIRMIMIGKINQLPTEIIIERLRDTYV